MKYIQNCSNEEPRPFPKENNCEFSRTTGPISNELDTKHSCMNGIQVYTNEEPCPFTREDIKLRNSRNYIDIF